jgi:hypothetical protein
VGTSETLALAAEITLEGLNVKTGYSKINTDRQVSEKTFESEEKSEKNITN